MKSISGFDSNATLAATDHVDGEEREYSLQIVDQAEDRSSLTSSNRSSITSDTDLMVNDTHTHTQLLIWEYIYTDRVTHEGVC